MKLVSLVYIKNEKYTVSRLRPLQTHQRKTADEIHVPPCTSTCWYQREGTDGPFYLVWTVSRTSGIELSGCLSARSRNSTMGLRPSNIRIQEHIRTHDLESDWSWS